MEDIKLIIEFLENISKLFVSFVAAIDKIIDVHADGRSWIVRAIIDIALISISILSAIVIFVIINKWLLVYRKLKIYLFSQNNHNCLEYVSFPSDMTTPFLTRMMYRLIGVDSGVMYLCPPDEVSRLSRMPKYIIRTFFYLIVSLFIYIQSSMYEGAGIAGVAVSVASALFLAMCIVSIDISIIIDRQPYGGDWIRASYLMVRVLIAVLIGGMASSTIVVFLERKAIDAELSESLMRESPHIKAKADLLTEISAYADSVNRPPLPGSPGSGQSGMGDQDPSSKLSAQIIAARQRIADAQACRGEIMNVERQTKKQNNKDGKYICSTFPGGVERKYYASGVRGIGGRSSSFSSAELEYNALGKALAGFDGKIENIEKDGLLYKDSVSGSHSLRHKKLMEMIARDFMGWGILPAALMGLFLVIELQPVITKFIWSFPEYDRHVERQYKMSLSFMQSDHVMKSYLPKLKDKPQFNVLLRKLRQRFYLYVVRFLKSR